MEITWLHLSDMHINSVNATDQKTIFSALVKDIEQQIIDYKISIDMVFFTGDVAFSASPEDYHLALDLLNDMCSSLVLNKNTFFIVPGNHDVNREKVSKIRDDQRKEFAERKDIDNVVKNRKEMDKYLERFDNYSDFINTFSSTRARIRSRTTLRMDSDDYYYGKVLDIKGVKVGVIGLNSVWASHGGRNDSNNIYVSNLQINSALNLVSDSDLKIVLMHHPISWLWETDQFDTENILNNHCDIILHGHIHRMNIQLIQTTKGNQIRIPAGAIFDGARVSSCYNITTLDTVREVIRIIPRRYNEVHYAYFQDLDALGTGKSDIFETKIPDNILSKIKKP